MTDNRERFKFWFFTYPEDFKGLMQDPYYFMRYGQEGHELLKEFGFCPMCEGTGTTFTECCNGHRCECGGRPVQHSCHSCNSTGRITDGHDEQGHSKFIQQLAETNKGYLYPHF